MKLKNLLINFLLLSSFTGFGQDVSDLISQYFASHHLEKIYVSHDKPFYIPGDTLWGNIFLVDGQSHLMFDAQPIVYIDWINSC